MRETPIFNSPLPVRESAAHGDDAFSNAFRRAASMISRPVTRGTAPTFNRPRNINTRRPAGVLMSSQRYLWRQVLRYPRERVIKAARGDFVFPRLERLTYTEMRHRELGARSYIKRISEKLQRLPLPQPTVVLTFRKIRDVTQEKKKWQPPPAAAASSSSFNSCTGGSAPPLV